MSIYKKLSEAKKEIGKISKDSRNPFFKSKYFDINSLLEHVEPILQKHGLIVSQPIKNNSVCSVIVDVESGDILESILKLPELQDPQKLGSAITYYRRYTLQSLLALQAEDDDANAATKSVKKDDNKPWLNYTNKDGSITPQWENIVKGIQTGSLTKISQVRNKYKVSIAVGEELEKLF